MFQLRLAEEHIYKLEAVLTEKDEKIKELEARIIELEEELTKPKEDTNKKKVKKFTLED